MANKIYYQEDCNLSMREANPGQKQKHRDLKYIQLQKQLKELTLS